MQRGQVLTAIEDGNNNPLGGISGLTDVEALGFAQVPIPGSVLMLFSGLLGLIGIRRIRSK